MHSIYCAVFCVTGLAQHYSNYVLNWLLTRRMMIEKIVSHVADFSPRLQSNTRALYQYCPIPIISFPALENELFCSIYYLRHLCDITRFPDWPIKDPVTKCCIMLCSVKVMSYWVMLFKNMYAFTFSVCVITYHVYKITLHTLAVVVHKIMVLSKLHS